MQQVSISSIKSGISKQLGSLNTKFAKKTKGTIVERWVNYWKQVGKDYTEVMISLKEESKQKPLKAAGYMLGLGCLSYCATHNPNLQSFRAKYVQCANDLGLVTSSVVNPVSLNHLKYIESCFNTSQIRYTNLGVASIIWADDFSSECKTFECTCSYLKTPYRKFGNQIIDIGFCNVWWIISRKMLDYDVNY